MKALLLVPPVEEKKLSVQTDAVLARCAGIILKSNYFLPPIGLAYLASSLREWARAEVNLLDCMVAGLNSEESINQIKSKSPDLIFFVLGTPTINYSVRWIARLKEELPKAVIVAIGPHVTALPEESLKATRLDFVIRGEPEVTSCNLVGALTKGKDIEKIKGISYRTGRSVIHNPGQPLLEDINQLPFPARDLLSNEKYTAPFAHHTPFGLIITARGCPFQCVYCATRGYYGKTWRSRSVENVVSELREMVQKYNLRDIGFWDDTFTINHKRVIAICQAIIEEKLNIEWICLSRVDTVNPEILSWMKRAGCYQIQFGVESGSEEILRTLGKNLTIKQIKDAFNWSKAAVIEPAAFFMLGNPGETEDSVQKTIELALELPASYASFNINTPYPGCELFEKMKDLLPGDWSHFDAKHASYQSGFDTKSLEKYIREAYRRFYYRPKYLLRLLFKIRSITALLRYLKTAFDIFRRF